MPNHDSSFPINSALRSPVALLESISPVGSAPPFDLASKKKDGATTSR